MDMVITWMMPLCILKVYEPWQEDALSFLRRSISSNGRSILRQNKSHPVVEEEAFFQHRLPSIMEKVFSIQKRQQTIVEKVPISQEDDG